MPNTVNTNCKMSSPRYLALWLGLQHIGYDAVEARIQHSVNLVVTALDFVIANIWIVLCGKCLFDICYGLAIQQVKIAKGRMHNGCQVFIHRVHVKKVPMISLL